MARIAHTSGSSSWSGCGTTSELGSGAPCSCSGLFGFGFISSCWDSCPSTAASFPLPLGLGVLSGISNSALHVKSQIEQLRPMAVGDDLSSKEFKKEDKGGTVNVLVDNWILRCRRASIATATQETLSLKEEGVMAEGQGTSLAGGALLQTTGTEAWLPRAGIGPRGAEFSRHFRIATSAANNPTHSGPAAASAHGYRHGGRASCPFSWDWNDGSAHSWHSLKPGVCRDFFFSLQACLCVGPDCHLDLASAA